MDSATSSRAPIEFAFRSTPRPTPRTKICSSSGPDRANAFTSIRSTRPPPSSPAAACAPALNNVIRSIYQELTRNYGVRHVFGIRNGYLGLNPASGLTPIPLTDAYVSEIHKLGGTALGSSRGPQDPKIIVDFLHRQGINMLFCVGGDGTQRGAARYLSRDHPPRPQDRRRRHSQDDRQRH